MVCCGVVQNLMCERPLLASSFRFIVDHGILFHLSDCKGRLVSIVKYTPLLEFGVTTVLHWLSIGTRRAIYMVFWIPILASKTTRARLGNSAAAQAYLSASGVSIF